MYIPFTIASFGIACVLNGTWLLILPVYCVLAVPGRKMSHASLRSDAIYATGRRRSPKPSKTAGAQRLGPNSF